MNKKGFILFGIVLFFFFFFGAFGIHFFSDDFKFLAASKQFNLFSFFSPLRTTFYRPIPTELFYYFLQQLPHSIITGHICIFIIFLIGIFFLYKTLILITKNKDLAFFSSILYLFHFSHVYQLYWFATFQEVAQFTFLICSLYFILKKQFIISIGLFILALFSKEQALLFPFLAFMLYFMKYKNGDIFFIIYFILDFIFIGIHLFVNSHMPILPEYVIHLTPKLIINNVLWYGLWSVGFPAMMSDYMRSILSLPFGTFWNYFTQPIFNIYFFGMLFYIISLIGSLCFILTTQVKERKRLVIYIVVGTSLFVFFLLPVLPIIHKWMVRLTIPLVFMSVIEGLILAILWKKKKAQKLVISLLTLYLIWNYFGIKFHETISTYMLESSINKQAIIVFGNVKRFENCNVLYIKDPKQMRVSSWEGSEKIALTFSGDSFLSYYFPGRKDLKVKYDYKSKDPSFGDCIIDASELIQ